VNIENKQKLRDRVAIVTGGGRGIGRAIALDFAREGANVVACGRNQTFLEEVSQEARRAGCSVLAVRTDVSIEGEVERMVDEAVKKFGKIDILVNNAAISGPRGLITDVSKEEWDEVLNINLTGTFLCSKAVLKHMIKSGTGNIINVTTSKGWKRRRPGAVPYRASKSGMEGFTLVLAKQMKPYGICVNAMGPATTDTDMQKNMSLAQKRRWRMWRPDEVSKLAVFLALQTVDTLTGASIDFPQWQRSLREN
jgi:3-oxoacyl-[acyl-carrier protein] reductase